MEHAQLYQAEIADFRVVWDAVHSMLEEYDDLDNKPRSHIPETEEEYRAVVKEKDDKAREFAERVFWLLLLLLSLSLHILDARASVCLLRPSHAAGGNGSQIPWRVHRAVPPGDLYPLRASPVSLLTLLFWSISSSL